MVQVSKHAKKRIKQRVGVSPKNSRMINKILSEGIHRERTKGRLRKYMDRIYNYRDNSTPLLYGDKVYVFSKDDVLITVLSLPSNLQKDYKKMIISK